MLSIYEQTQQGNQTRSRLLNHISPDEELSRKDLMNRSGLTYDQVRRQTKNLCIEGILKSRIKGEKRLYRLRVPRSLKQKELKMPFETATPITPGLLNGTDSAS